MEQALNDAPDKLSASQRQIAAKAEYHIGQAIAALKSDNGPTVRAIEDAGDPATLLETAEKICAKASRKTTPPIRTFHHLSCTGGTMLSKCIASMSNVLLLNEIDYNSTLGQNPSAPAFSPTDLISLIRQNDGVADCDLITRIFVSDISLLLEEESKIGRSIVLRDHSHGHFLVDGRTIADPTLLEITKRHFSVKSLVSVRDPADSYASMVVRGWNKHFSPSSFDEYCRRYAIFLDRHRDAPIVKYEDFVAEPQKTMQEICRILDLNYFPEFADVYDSFAFSGDSGRGGGAIAPRERRAISAEYGAEIAQSKNYALLRQRLGYERV